MCLESNVEVIYLSKQKVLRIQPKYRRSTNRTLLLPKSIILRKGSNGL